MYLIIYVCIVCTYVDIEKYLLAMTPMDPYKGQKRFFQRGFFQKILYLFMVSIQERFLIKGGL